MSRETRSGGGLEDKDKSPVSDVDKLIAEAEAAASEAERAAATEAVQATQTKKKVSAEAASRAEQLQQRFSALKAEDAFVEDYAYEWVLGAYEAETGIAAPEKATETIAALRKTGDALRKLAPVEPKSAALLKKMEDLQKLHDTLFEQVQAMTTDTLDVVKKKYKGEETEFERRHKALSESPLVRGVEFDTHSPEAREKALKQEITEFLMRPLTESRLQPLQKRITDSKGQLAKLQEESKKYGSTRHEEGENADYYATEIARRLGLISPGQSKIWANELKGMMSRGIKHMDEQVKNLEIQLAREQLAFEINRSVIEESMEGEHDETVLREGMVGLRTYIGELRKNVNRGGALGEWKEGAPTPKSSIAQKILGQYQQHAVQMPEGHTFELGTTLGMRAMLPAEQLVESGASRAEYNRGTSATEYLRHQSRLDFLKLRLADEIDDEEVFRILMPRENDLTPGFIQSLYAEGPQYRTAEAQQIKEKLFQKFPKPDALINRIFGEQGRLLNLRRAHQKIDQGLQGVKKPEVAALPKELVVAGWRESKLGAFVEPGQNVREVDREYAQMLERFSKPQIDAERAFDVRGPEGEFHVYTTEQAVGLLRRARRDARDIVLRSDRAVEEARGKIEGDAKGKEGLEAQVKRLNEEAEAERKKAVAREKDIREQLKLEGDEARKQATQFLTQDVARISGERDRLQEVRRGALAELEAAMKKKAGLLGGDKELRSVVERVMGQLKGK